MKQLSIIIGIGLLLCLLIVPAAANTSTADPYNLSYLQVNVSLPENVNVTPWYAATGEYTKYWFDYDGTGDFLPYSFLMSITQPYTQVIGSWFFIALWLVYVLGVWNRERGIELTIVMMLITGSLWGLLMPFESFWTILVMMAIGITGIIFRLIKR